MAENKNKRSAEHLGRWQWPKGVSGNPGGRPKKRPYSEANADVAGMQLDVFFRHQLELAWGCKLPRSTTYAQAIALGQHRQAVTHARSAKEVREAVEGKAAVRIELTGKDGAELRTGSTDQEFVELIRRIYGLSEEAVAGDADDTVSVPKTVASGQKSKKDSEQK